MTERGELTAHHTVTIRLSGDNAHTQNEQQKETTDAELAVEPSSPGSPPVHARRAGGWASFILFIHSFNRHCVIAALALPQLRLHDQNSTHTLNNENGRRSLVCQPAPRSNLLPPSPHLTSPSRSTPPAIPQAKGLTTIQCSLALHTLTRT